MRQDVPMVGHVVIFRLDAIQQLHDDVQAALTAKGIRVSRVDVETIDDRDRDVMSADIWVVGPNHRFTRDEIAAAPRLRAMVSIGIGVETLDIEAATELGVAIAVGAIPENFLSMAEATVMLMLV